jgi:hypothetical protein
LKLKCDEPLSNVAFNFNVRRYIKALDYLYLVRNPDLAPLPEEVEQLSTARGGICTITM